MKENENQSRRKQTLTSRREGIYEEALGHQIILFDSASRESVTLNAAATFVWSRCDGRTTLADIIAAFERENLHGQGEAEVLTAYNLLAGKGLLLDEDLMPVAPAAHSRRAMLSYGALAAKVAIAFPLVGSFLNPSAARADGAKGQGRGHDSHGRGHGYGHDKARGKGHDKHHTPDPVDCYGGWGEWSECDWFMQAREYTVIVPAANGGLACEVEDGTIETQDCGEPPVDCAGTWGPWGPCSVTCGGGTQQRNFTVTTPAANGGAACPVSPETQACNTLVCQSTVAVCTDCNLPYQNCDNGVCINYCNPDTYDRTCCFYSGAGWFDDC